MLSIKKEKDFHNKKGRVLHLWNTLPTKKGEYNILRLFITPGQTNLPDTHQFA